MRLCPHSLTAWGLFLACDFVILYLVTLLWRVQNAFTDNETENGMGKEITSGCKRITVLLQGEWMGHRIAETVTADYWLSCAVSPDVCADDVAVCGLWGAGGYDMLCGEGENYPDMSPRIAYLYRAACFAVAGAVVMDADDSEWLGWDAWPGMYADVEDRIAIAASARRGY